MILGLALLIIAVTLYFVFKYINNNSQQKISSDTTHVTDNPVYKQTGDKKPDMKYLLANIERQLDSILFSFGIKKEWIATSRAGAHEKSEKVPPTKSYYKDASWFLKDVIIPKDLSSAEVNLDLSLYTKNSGLVPSATEDIKTKDIEFDISSSDSSAMPMVRIYLNHSDKVTRESGTFSIILNNIGDYKKDEIDKILSTTNEFSFIFPRSFENVELQNKLIQLRKDVIINMTLSAKDNSDADFLTSDEKDLKTKIKSFITDYPSISKVIISRADAAPLPQGMAGKIKEEFLKFNIRAIGDTALIPVVAKSEEDSKDKVSIIISNLKNYAAKFGKGIAVVTLSYDDFIKLYNEILVLKKLGYKFYNLAEYFTKESDKEKKDKLKEEKLTEKKEEKKDTKKNVKVPPQKDDKKKDNIKKDDKKIKLNTNKK